MIKIFKIIFSLIILTMLLGCPPLGDLKITVHEKDIDPRWKTLNGGYNSQESTLTTASISDGSGWVFVFPLLLPVAFFDCVPEQFYQEADINHPTQTDWKIKITFTNKDNGSQNTYTFYKPM